MTETLKGDLDSETSETSWTTATEVIEDSTERKIEIEQQIEKQQTKENKTNVEEKIVEQNSISNHVQMLSKFLDILKTNEDKLCSTCLLEILFWI